MTESAKHSKQIVTIARINNSHIPQSPTINSLCAPADKRRSVWSWSVYWMRRKCCLSASERHCSTPIMLVPQTPSGLSANARKMTHQPLGHGPRHSGKQRQNRWTARNCWILHAVFLIITLSTMGELWILFMFLTKGFKKQDLIGLVYTWLIQKGKRIYIYSPSCCP